MLAHLHTLYGCFCTTVAKLCNFDSDLCSTKPKIITIWPFTEKVCQTLPESNIFKKPEERKCEPSTYIQQNWPSTIKATNSFKHERQDTLFTWGIYEGSKSFKLSNDDYRSLSIRTCVVHWIHLSVEPRPMIGKGDRVLCDLYGANRTEKSWEAGTK